MQKYFKHLILLLVVVSAFIAFPCETKAEKYSAIGWWSNVEKCHKSSKGYYYSVAAEVGHNKSHFKKYEPTSRNTTKSPKTFIMRRRVHNGYEYYLCWLTVNQRGGNKTNTYPDSNYWPSVINFKKGNAYWNTVGYSITDDRLPSNSKTCVNGKHFFFRYTDDGKGKYLKSKFTKKVDKIKHNPVAANSKGGCIYVWKYNRKDAHSRDYTSLHYLKLYDPNDSSAGLIPQIRKAGFKTVKKYSDNYPFGYADIYVHDIGCLWNGCRTNFNRKPIYERANARKHGANPCEAIKSWNVKLKVPLLPTVRVRAIDLSTNEVMKLPDKFMRTSKGKLITKFGSEKTKTRKAGEKFTFTRSNNQVLYDIEFPQSCVTYSTKKYNRLRSKDPHHRSTKEFIEYFQREFEGTLIDNPLPEDNDEEVYVPEEPEGPEDSPGIEVDISEKEETEQFFDENGNPLPDGEDAPEGDPPDDESTPDDPNDEILLNEEDDVITSDEAGEDDEDEDEDNDEPLQYGTRLKKGYILVGADAVISNIRGNRSGTSSRFSDHSLRTDAITDRLKKTDKTYRYSRYYNTDVMKRVSGSGSSHGDVWQIKDDVDLNKANKDAHKEVNKVIKSTGAYRWGHDQIFYDKDSKTAPEFVFTFYYLPGDPPEEGDCIQWYIGDGASINDKKFETLPSHRNAKGETPEDKGCTELHVLDKDELNPKNPKNSIARYYKDHDGIVYSVQGYSIKKDKLSQRKNSHDVAWLHEKKSAKEWQETLYNEFDKVKAEDIFYAVVPPVVTVTFTQHYKLDGTYTWKQECEVSKPDVDDYYLNGTKKVVPEFENTSDTVTALVKGALVERGPVDTKYVYVKSWHVKEYDDEDPPALSSTLVDSYYKDGKQFRISDGFTMPKRATLAIRFYTAEKVDDEIPPPEPEDPKPTPYDSTEPEPITPINNTQDILHIKEYSQDDPGFGGPTLPDNPSVIPGEHHDFNGIKSSKVEEFDFDLSKLQKFGIGQSSYHQNHEGKPWTYMDERWDYGEGQPWIESETSGTPLSLSGMERGAKVSIVADEENCSSGYDAEINIPTSENLKTFGELNKYEVNIEIRKIKTTYSYSGTFKYYWTECIHHDTYTCSHCGYTSTSCNTGGTCPEGYWKTITNRDSEGNVISSYQVFIHYSHSHGCLCTYKQFTKEVTSKPVTRDTIYYQLSDGAAYYPTDYTVWNDCLDTQGMQTVYEYDKGGKGNAVTWKQNLGFTWTKGWSKEPSTHLIHFDMTGPSPVCGGGKCSEDDDRKNCVVPGFGPRQRCYSCSTCHRDNPVSVDEATARVDKAIAHDESAQNGDIIFEDGEGGRQSLADKGIYKYCYVPGWITKKSDPCNDKFYTQDEIPIPRDRYNGLHNSSYDATEYSLKHKEDISWGDEDVPYTEPTATVHYTLSPRGHVGCGVGNKEVSPYFENDYIYSVPVNDIRIHTPTVCNSWITTNPDNVQLLENQESLVLDTWFYVHVDAEGDNITDPGYGTQDYSRYLSDGIVDGEVCKVGYVKFDFAVMRQDNGAWSYYNPNVWIPCRLGDTLFYIPTTDDMVDEANIVFQTRAENCFVSAFEEENGDVTLNDKYNAIFFKNRSDKVEEYANMSNWNYVAEDNTTWAISGRVYNFKIDDITDYPIWEKEFRNSDGTLSWNSLHSGLYDRDYFQRYDDALQTLVPVTGTNDAYRNQTALNTGYAFRYSFETVGDFENKEDSITIVPRFSWLGNDGKTRIDDVSVYYNDKIGDKFESLVKVGSDRDKKNRKSFSLESYGIGQSTLDSTAAALGYNETEDFTSIKSELFCPSKILITSNFRTFDGVYHKSNLIDGTRTDFLDIKQAVDHYYEDTGVSMDDFYRSVQNWYGEYYLPSEIFVTDVSDSEVRNAISNDFTGDESIWKKDGYLVVTFEIIVNNDAKPYIGYANTDIDYGNRYGEILGVEKTLNFGTCNMWEHEGFMTSKKDINNKEWSFKAGDVVMYDIAESREASAQAAYTSGGTH